MPSPLWFRREYVEAILRDEKRTTTRARSTLQPGDVVNATVGPRAPFATLRIIGRRELHIDDVHDDQYRRTLHELYPTAQVVIELTFERI